MSQENVEFVRRAVDSLNRGDADAFLEAMADDIQADWSNSHGPQKGVHTGKEQVRKLWTSFVEAFDEVGWDPEEIIDVGPNERRAPEMWKFLIYEDKGGAYRWRLLRQMARSLRPPARASSHTRTHSGQPKTSKRTLVRPR